MSFVAAFFTINIIEFPQDSINGGSGLHLSYVARYIFGIGFSISIPLIIIAFFMSDSDGWIWRFKNWLGRRKVSDHNPVASPDPVDNQRLEMEKGRPSRDSWRYGHIRRVDTGGTDRSQDVEVVSPV